MPYMTLLCKYRRPHISVYITSHYKVGLVIFCFNWNVLPHSNSLYWLVNNNFAERNVKPEIIGNWETEMMIIEKLPYT